MLSRAPMEHSQPPDTARVQYIENAESPIPRLASRDAIPARSPQRRQAATAMFGAELGAVFQRLAIGVQAFSLRVRPNPSLKRRPATAATVWPLQALV